MTINITFTLVTPFTYQWQWSDIVIVSNQQSSQCLPAQYYSELISIGKTSDVVNYKVLYWNTKQLKRGKMFENAKKESG